MSSDPIRDALDHEDKLLLALADASFKRARGEEPTPTPAPEPEQVMVPINPAEERQAFADLIAFIAQHKDADTEFTHVSVEEFMQGLDEPALANPAQE